jgi:hypothetical protein
MKALFGPFIGRVLVLVRSVGPYAAIELLLPGGSMVWRCFTGGIAIG